MGESRGVLAFVPSQGHVLAIASPAVLALAGLGVLPLSSRTVFPSLELTLGVRGGVLRPISKALSHRITVATAQAHAMAGANGHVSPHGPSPD